MRQNVPVRPLTLAALVLTLWGDDWPGRWLGSEVGEILESLIHTTTSQHTTPDNLKVFHHEKLPLLTVGNDVTARTPKFSFF